MRCIAFIGLLVCFTWSVSAQKRLQAELGVLDARHWNFHKDRLALSGYWKAIEGRLVDPQAVYTTPSADHFFPAVWNDVRNDGSGSGYVTYFLNVLVPDSIQSWAIEVPQVYSGFRLFVNEKEIGSAGTVSENNVRPQWIVKTMRFELPQSDTLKLVLQIANFHHHKGGIKHPVYLGTPENLFNHRTAAYTSNGFEIVVIFLEGIVFVILAVMRRKRIILFFSLLCLTWTIRSMFSNLYAITVLIPDFDWNWQVRIEYLTLYLTMIWAVLFLQELFSKIGSRKFSYTIVLVNVFFILFTLFSSPLMFTQWVSLYLAVAGVLVAYGGFLVIRAVFYEHAGAWFLLGSVMMGVITFGYDIISYQTALSYNFVFLNIGYIVMFMLTAVAMLFHLNVLKDKKSNVLTYNDLFDKN
ncbi:MAG TPA: 7TM-DISM domain-containing protein [Ohtaekwangia sp.]